MKSLQGHFLVASPHLPDSNFFRSVVLMIQHDEEGAFGVVLNRPTDNTIAEIWEMIGDEPCDSQQMINLGGPVSGPLMAVHTQRSFSENEVLPGVFLSTRKEHLNHIVKQCQRPFRIFSGYAGWAAGQLEDELEVGGWMTVRATRDDIFAHEDDLWKRIARHIGLDILSPTIKRSAVPEDPSLN